MAPGTEGHATLLESYRADLSAELAIRQDEGLDVHEVDVYQAFRDFEADGGDIFSLYASDGGHLSTAGDALVAELLEAAIEEGEGL